MFRVLSLRDSERDVNNKDIYNKKNIKDTNSGRLKYQSHYSLFLYYIFQYAFFYKIYKSASDLHLTTGEK